MSSPKFWRPFETPMERCTASPPCSSPNICCDGQQFESQSTKYTFDLNRQNSRPIAYLSSDSQQLFGGSLIHQYLSGGTLVSERTHPNVIRTKDLLIKDKFVPILPKGTNYENRLNLPKERLPFKCEFNGCGKTFRFRSALLNHRLVHSDERKFCCNQCGKRYKQLSGLYSHESVKHLGKNKKFVCDSCGESFVDYRNLRIHEYNQHENDEFMRFITEQSYNYKHLERPSMGLDYNTGHHSEDSNH